MEPIFIHHSMGCNEFSYAFDTIGNRNTALEAGAERTYSVNDLNQYTSVTLSETVSSSRQYDADGNATQIETSTGTWSVTYNGENRPVRFENAETQTVVECAYDSQGRRFEKKVTVAGATTLHHRYIYRGYLQIAALDLTRAAHPALWLVTWDPSQPTATRPLAIQKDGTWFTYGYDLTKNICEVFGPAGYIRTTYSYAPFGAVTASDNGVIQPFQWSSEHYDPELGLVYYNYRHYSPTLGRFLSRDPIQEQGGLNLYAFVGNETTRLFDSRGSKIEGFPDYILKENESLPEDILGQINANRSFGITLSSHYRGAHPSPLHRICYTKCYQVSSSGVPPTLILEMRNLDDYDTEEHELVHFEFFKSNWIVARNLLNSLEGVYCDSLSSDQNIGKKNAGLAVKYGMNAVRLYEKKTKHQNIEYDWLSYGQVNNDSRMAAERNRIQAELIKLEESYNQAKKEFEQI